MEVVHRGASLVAQLVKNLPEMQETLVRSLGQEDPWRREWLPTLVFLPGESYGQRSLEVYSPWCHKELVVTEATYICTQTAWPSVGKMGKKCNGLPP